MNARHPSHSIFIFASALSFMAGLFIGLVILGWWLWPVQWVGGTLEHVDQAIRADYLRAAIDSYGYRQDAALASQRYNLLGKYKESTLAAIYQTDDAQTKPAIAAFASVVEATEVLGSELPAPSPLPGASRRVSDWALRGLYGCRALDASGAEMITVAVRRVDLASRGAGSLLEWIPPDQFHILPNTAGCTTAKEAVTTAQLARELLDTRLVKLEVIGDPRTLFPDTTATPEAARILIADGFTVLPYISDDPVACMRLEEMGCAAVMPLGAPIGSGLGLRNPTNLRIILESVSCPVIVDAGVGTASDAAIAMELGCTAVLMNTGIASAKDPIRRLQAFLRQSRLFRVSSDC